MEIERKFLVAKLPEDLGAFPKAEIRQGYLEITDKTETRLRQKGNKYLRTVKTGAGKVREETETEITGEEFRALWPGTDGRRVEKTRYDIPYGKFTIELDIYRNALKGLIVAEVEFESAAASEAFLPPDWLGREVTEDKSYKNQSLATNGLPKS